MVFVLLHLYASLFEWIWSLAAFVYGNSRKYTSHFLDPLEAVPTKVFVVMKRCIEIFERWTQAPFSSKIANPLSSIKGTFEIHITVILGKGQTLIQLSDFAGTWGMKTTMILLEAGDFPKQIMVTCHETGDYLAVFERVNKHFVPRLETSCKVIRVKIESLFSNPGVPANNIEKKLHPVTCYFEFHWKIEVGAISRDYDALCEWQKTHPEVHLSRNAFGSSPKNPKLQYYFLTYRDYYGGKQESIMGFGHIGRDLINDGWNIVKAEREYVVYDSKIELDRGWLNAPVPNINLDTEEPPPVEAWY